MHTEGVKGLHWRLITFRALLHLGPNVITFRTLLHLGQLLHLGLEHETHHQNMAVMAVWRRRWKRHTLVSLTTLVFIALWTSTLLLIIVRGRFKESSNQPCKMPFT